MALSNPYPLAFLSDQFGKKSGVTFGIQRNDEMSGSGDGRFWAARLAIPLWTISMSLSARSYPEARAVDAKIFALDGMRRGFLFADPAYTGPASGTITSPGKTVSSISTDRTQIGISGLPANFVISPGDRLSIAWGTGRVYFGTFAEPRTANGSGVLAQTEIFPFLPAGISTGATVELLKPYLKVIIPPGGYTPFSARPGFYSEGASLTMLQKP